MKYQVRIGCRNAGAIGTMHHIKRSYIIETDDREQLHRLTIDRAYQDGDIEHVLVEHVAREVQAYDLELYAVNTGAFYRKHVALAGKELEAWEQHLRALVIPHYSVEIEPVFATAETVEQVAGALSAYYQQHAKEGGQ